MANVVHALSGREGPLVAVNCGAIPSTLIESELFGSRRGAFSGAEDRPGLVRSADRGTLFLDEVAELPMSSQAALLRVLQEKELLPLGATRSISRRRARRRRHQPPGQRPPRRGQVPPRPLRAAFGVRAAPAAAARASRGPRPPRRDADRPPRPRPRAADAVAHRGVGALRLLLAAQHPRARAVPVGGAHRRRHRDLRRAPAPPHPRRRDGAALRLVEPARAARRHHPEARRATSAPSPASSPPRARSSTASSPATRSAPTSFVAPPERTLCVCTTVHRGVPRGTWTIVVGPWFRRGGLWGVLYVGERGALGGKTVSVSDRVSVSVSDSDSRDCVGTGLSGNLGAR